MEMSKAIIPLTEANKKAITNFIATCRFNGLENASEPNFTFKEQRDGIGKVIFDLFYRDNGVDTPGWNLTVKTDTDVRFHDDVPAKKGDIYCYLDSYRIEKGSLDLKHKVSKFNIFSF